MKLNRTFNIERPKSNIERKRMRADSRSMLSVQCSRFDVRLNSSLRTRRAFSFAEVMFAVVILGIGFIMVAAVFPVAIHQTQSTGEENSAANAARAAAVGIAALPTTQPNLLYNPAATTGSGTVKLLDVFPPTIKNYVLGTQLGPLQTAVAPPAIVVPFVGPRWEQIKASLISSLDPRYSYVPFYRRENNSPVAELIVIAVTNRNRAIYNSTDVQTSTVQTQSVPQTQYTNVQVQTAVTAYPSAQLNTQICADTITFTASPPSPTGLPSLEGCTINVPDPPAVQSTPPVPNPTSKTYMIGRPLTNPNQYELCAPDGLALTAGTGGLWGAGGALNDLTAGTPMSCTLNLPTTLQPVVAYAELLASPANPAGEIEFFTSPTSLNAAPAAATPGAFVIVSDDAPFYIWTSTIPTSPDPFYQLPPNSTFPPTYQLGALNGRIFRLGQPVAPSVTPQIPVGTFLLDPAYGMRPGGVTSPDSFYYGSPSVPSVLSGNARLKVYIVGAGDAGNTVSSNSGAAQDMGVFATYIQVQ